MSRLECEATRKAALAFFAFQRPTTTSTITNVKPARLYPPLPFPTFPFLLSLLTPFSLIFLLCLLPQSTHFPFSRFLPTLPDYLPSQGGAWKQSKMFTFNFTFHVPNPFSMSTLTSVASAATDAFNSVATDIREDPELLNYMVAGMGPGLGVAGGFGYDPNRLVKSRPRSSFTSFSPPTSPKSRGSEGSQGRHAVGLGLAHPHAQNRKRHLPGHDRNRASDVQGSTSGFVFVNPPPGSGTPKFPTQTYSQPSSYLSSDTHGLGQGFPVSTRLLRDPLPEPRERGWIPALSEPSYASTNEDFTTGFFDTPRYFDVNEMGSVASKLVLGLDGYESSGMESSVGDRRKRGEGESESDTMDAGEYFACISHFFTLSFESLCLSLPSSPLVPVRMLSCSGAHPLFVRSPLGLSLPHVQSPGNGTERYHSTLLEGVMRSQFPSLPLSLHDRDPSSLSPPPYFSFLPPPLCMGE